MFLAASISTGEEVDATCGRADNRSAYSPGSRRRGSIDPAQSAQLMPLMRMPRRVFSSPASDAVVHRHTDRSLLLCSMSRFSLGRYRSSQAGKRGGCLTCLSPKKARELHVGAREIWRRFKSVRRRHQYGPQEPQAEREKKEPKGAFKMLARQSMGQRNPEARGQD